MADRYEEKAREIRDAHFLSIAAANTRHGLAAACDVVERALADALRDQDAWHEIDDPEHPAPRDGTPFDAWALGSNARFIDVFWSDYRQEWCVDGEDGESCPLPPLRCWRPLPPPPTTGRERG